MDKYLHANVARKLQRKEDGGSKNNKNVPREATVTKLQGLVESGKLLPKNAKVDHACIYHVRSYNMMFVFIYHWQCFSFCIGKYDI